MTTSRHKRVAMRLLWTAIMVGVVHSYDEKMFGEMDANALFPRVFMGAEMGSPVREPLRLDKRQDPPENVQCKAGESPCNAIKVKGCCPNDQYCYINSGGAQKCCSKDSRCDDPCPQSQYRCTVSSKASCCPRPCAAPTAFQCVNSAGSPCCNLGSTCVSDNKSCRSSFDPSSTSSGGTSATPTSCATGQTSCPAAQGGGCCPTNAVCKGSTLCANLGASGPTSTSSASAASPAASHGLSSGAKAGIGVGVAIAGLLIVGFLAWFILRSRRRAKLREEHRRQERSGTGVAAPFGAPPTSNVPSPGMVSAPGRPPLVANTSDYFSQTGASGVAPSSTGAASGGSPPPPGSMMPSPSKYTDAAGASGLAPAFSPGRAVPVTPQSPGDIVTPVEIDESRPSPSFATAQRRDPSTGGGPGVHTEATSPELPAELQDRPSELP